MIGCHWRYKASGEGVGGIDYTFSDPMYDKLLIINSKNNKLKRMRYFLLFIFSLNSYAGNDEPHPIIDSDYVSKYLYNTKDLSTSNLIEIKELLKKNLQRNGNSKIKTQEEMDKELLDALLKYDDIRINNVCNR